MINGLGLIKSFLVQVFRFVRFLFDDRRALGVTSSHDVMRSEVQRTKGVDGDLAVEPKPIETNRSDFLAILIEDAKLQWRRTFSMHRTLYRDEKAGIACSTPRRNKKSSGRTGELAILLVMLEERGPANQVTYWQSEFYTTIVVYF